MPRIPASTAVMEVRIVTNSLNMSVSIIEGALPLLKYAFPVEHFQEILLLYRQ
jgi:hypothetical protein